MKLPARSKRKTQPENTIALINIVFLMLIFFLIAGSLAPPMDPEIDLIETSEAAPVEPPLALFVTRSGELRYQGDTLRPEAFITRLRSQTSERPAPFKPDIPVDAAGASRPGPLVRMAVDGRFPAPKLVGVIDDLRRAGAGKITIIAERKGQ